MGRDERGVTPSIGIDITHLAITLIKKRLRDSFGEAIDRSYAIVGEPVSLPDAPASIATNSPGYQRPGHGLSLPIQQSESNGVKQPDKE